MALRWVSTLLPREEHDGVAGLPRSHRLAVRAVAGILAVLWMFEIG